MTREEREQMIAQLQLENARSLEEIARREASMEAQDLECDQLLAKLAARRQQPESFQIIRRDYCGEQLPAAPQRRTTMDQADSEPWNAWFRQCFDDRIDRVVEIIGEEMGKADRHVRDELRAEIGELRAEILRGVVKTNGRTKRRA